MLLKVVLDLAGLCLPQLLEQEVVFPWLDELRVHPAILDDRNLRPDVLLANLPSLGLELDHPRSPNVVRKLHLQHVGLSAPTDQLAELLETGDDCTLALHVLVLELALALLLPPALACSVVTHALCQAEGPVWSDCVVSHRYRLCAIVEKARSVLASSSPSGS
jgi:hypothetical protein